MIILVESNQAETSESRLAPLPANSQIVSRRSQRPTAAMRLIDTSTIQLQWFHDDQIPEYAILRYTEKVPVCATYLPFKPYLGPR